MKHDPLTVLKIVILFTLTQYVGLLIHEHYLVSELPMSVNSTGAGSITYILTGIIVTTLLAYILTKFKYDKLLTIWFSSAVLITLVISFSAFLNSWLALALALTITILRVSTNDLYIHNLAELFIYGGIASIFAPLFNPLSMIALLIIISIYDYVSVFITKHMVMMAKSQEAVNLFTGLMVKSKGHLAILGGGDIGFSLLFITVMRVAYGLVSAYISLYFVTASLITLMLLGKKGKYYPAMPFITIGCLASYLIMLI